MKKLPEYENARKAREQFYVGLTSSQKDQYQQIAEYACYLETAGPQLAHYFGYLLANELLCRVVPGYSPDLEHTLRYGRYLEEYFGTPLSYFTSC